METSGKHNSKGVKPKLKGVKGMYSNSRHQDVLYDTSNDESGPPVLNWRLEDSSDDESSDDESQTFEDHWGSKDKPAIMRAKVNMTSTEEGWKFVRSNLKTKMYLADTGANMHVVESGSLLQNVRDWKQDVMVGRKRILQSKTKGDLAIKTKGGMYIRLLG